MDGGLRGRVVVTVVAALVLGAAATAYAVRSSRRAPVAAAVTSSAGPVTLDTGPRLLLVRDRRLVSLASVAGGDVHDVRVSAVECVRAHAAGGTGACLHQDNPWEYSLRVLDARLRTTASFRVPGLPNRARVSPSGRLVAWTSFVGGHAYNGGQFATRTGVLDTATGGRIEDLESFAVVRDGKPYRSADVNFWGVTFAADDNGFWATMSTSGNRYLVAGDLAARRVRTVAENVECPSLSPDGTRLAFKRAVGGDPDRGWRLSVLDLATLRVTPLAETRSVDDQAAWLSRDLVGYTLRDGAGEPSVWSVAADGSGRPRLVADSAESPTALAG